MNGTVIYELLEEMEKNVALLEELRSLSEDEFVADPRNYLYAERCFQLSIQCLVDICYYLAAQKGWQKPESSSEAVILMGRQGAIDATFAEEIVGMANFLNILVHAYLKINRKTVYALLSKLEHFHEFARQILRYLD